MSPSTAIQFIDTHWSKLIKILSNRSAFLNVVGCLKALTDIDNNYLNFSYLIDDSAIIALTLLLNIKKFYQIIKKVRIDLG